MGRVCSNCGKLFLPCRSVPGQSFCGNPACQRARKRIWQKQKLASDTDYRDNQKSSQKAWRAANSEYMREYRAHHHDYVVKNRIQQSERNKSRKKILEPAAILTPSSSSLIVKMDEIKSALSSLLVPMQPTFFNPGFIVKMDEFNSYKQPLSVILHGSIFSGVDCKEMTSSPCPPRLITLWP